MSTYLPVVNPKPNNVNTLGIITLVSGISNLGYGLFITATVAVSTLGIGLLCAPFFMLPAILGIFELIYASKLMSNPPVPARPNQTLAILEICGLLTGNFIAVIAGIVALVLYNDRQVIEYFAQFKA